MTKRYDELKQDDVIMFHGAKLIVKAVRFHNVEGFHVVSFDVAPFDDEALEMLGAYYANGTYSGAAFLAATLA